MDLELEKIFWKKLADSLLDSRCDLYGVDDTIEWLLKDGYTVDELLFLHFQKADIDNVLDDIKMEGK